MAVLLEVAALVAFFGSSRRAPLVAFTARIYNPPGDRRIALHEVFVSELDGSRRRRLTSGRCDCVDVRWIGKSRLAWIEYVPGSEESIGYRADANRPQRLVMYDLASKRKRLVATGKIGRYIPPESRFGSATGTRGEALYEISGRPYSLRGGKLIAVKDAPESNEPNVWNWSGRPTIELLGEGGQRQIIKLAAGGSEEGPAPVFVCGGKRHEFRIGGVVMDLIPSVKEPDVTWCLTGSYASSAGSHEWIYRLDWKSDKARLVVDDLLGIDFQPDDRYYAGVTTNKVVRPLGKKQVWARDVVAGDAQTGKRWVVLGGVVHASSVSIQP